MSFSMGIWKKDSLPIEKLNKAEFTSECSKEKTKENNGGLIKSFQASKLIGQRNFYLFVEKKHETRDFSKSGKSFLLEFQRNRKEHYVPIKSCFFLKRIYQKKRGQKVWDFKLRNRLKQIYWMQQTCILN